MTGAAGTDSAAGRHLLGNKLRRLRAERLMQMQLVAACLGDVIKDAVIRWEGQINHER
jgi:hypothetical protein